MLRAGRRRGRGRLQLRLRQFVGGLRHAGLGPGSVREYVFSLLRGHRDQAVLSRISTLICGPTHAVLAPVSREMGEETQTEAQETARTLTNVHRLCHFCQIRRQ